MRKLSGSWPPAPRLPLRHCCGSVKRSGVRIQKPESGIQKEFGILIFLLLSS